MKSNDKTIGSLIRTMRREKDITQKELSDKVNISRSYLAAIETNIYTPSSKILFLILNELGADIGILKDINFIKNIDK